MTSKQESEKMNAMIRSATGRAPSAQEIHRARQTVAGVGGELPAKGESSLEILCRQRGAVNPRIAAKLIGENAADPEAALLELRVQAPELFAARKPVGSANAGEVGGVPAGEAAFDLGAEIRARRNGGWGV